MREVSETLTTAEVEAAQLRDRHRESNSELAALGETLGRELAPTEAPLDAAERERIEVKLAQTERRREQIGPVNPLAAREYEQASEHVKDLATQRKDMEAALAELRALIRRTDREIAQAFEDTFEATARNFEEMITELFPGGSGRLRKVDVAPPKPGWPPTATRRRPRTRPRRRPTTTGPRPTRPGASRSRSRPRARARGGCRCSRAARSRWSRSDSCSPC